MATHALPVRLSFRPETNAGTPPANAAAWASDATSIRIISGSLDISGLQQSVIEDERSQLYVNDDEPVILGIRGGVTFSFEAYLHGHGDSPADGDTVAANALSTLLLNCLGGRDLADADDCVASGVHSTTQVETTDTYAVGQWISLDDSNGIAHQRRIMSSTAGGVGQIHTLHRALPFTPSDGDLCTGLITMYPDEDVLEDSAGASGRTLSFLIEKGRTSQRQAWECRGCKVNLTGITLDRNGAPKLQFTVMVASFIGPESAPTPTWSNTIEGAAGIAIGPNTEVFFENQGTTTDTTLQVSGFTIEPGWESMATETQTEDSANMIGIYGYSLNRAPGRVSFQAVPHADARITEFTASTVKHIQFERRAARGSGWSFYFPDCTHEAEPNFADVGNLLSQGLSLRTHQEGAQSTNIARARMQIVLA